MTSSYRLQTPEIPSSLVWKSFSCTLWILALLLAGSFFYPPLTFLSAVEEGGEYEEESAPSWTVRFNQVSAPPSLPSISETPVMEREEIVEPTLQESPTESTPEESQGVGEGTGKRDLKAGEANTLNLLAKELNRNFHKVKYYSPAARAAGLEGVAILWVQIDAGGSIASIRSEHALDERLASDLALSVEKLQKNWRARYKLSQGVTIRMQVIYTLRD